MASHTPPAKDGSPTLNGDAAGNGNPKLLPHHRAELYRSGLTDDYIAECRFYSATNRATVREALKWDRDPPASMVPALGIPYRGPGGYFSGYCRLKADSPRPDEHGKPIKYESPRGQPNRAYSPRRTVGALAEPSKPLILTEGEKKACAADQAGLPCVGLVGVHGWTKKRPIAPDGTKGPLELIDDLKAVEWKGRDVVIVFDSDIVGKPVALLGEWDLAKMLAAEGANVRVARLPPGPNGEKVGLDDYLLTHSADELRQLLAAAGPAEAPSAPWAAPVPLGEEFDAPEFPRGVLSPWHEAWVDATNGT